MRFVIVSIVVAAMMLVGCSNEVAKTLARAKAESNPVAALAIIRQAKSSFCEGEFHSSCYPPDDLLSAEDEYFPKAAKSGDAHVLRELFTSRSEKLVPLQTELKSSVIERARTSKDRELLIAAANIFGNESIGVINSVQQLAYLERAWAAGDDASAGSMAHVFVRRKDYENAYLWSLRCVRSCNREDGVREGEFVKQIQLGELAKHLSQEQITKLQMDAAKSPSNDKS